MKHLLLTMIAAAAVFPAAARAEALSADQKKEVEAMIHEYILNHGDIVIEAVNKYQAKQEEESNKQAEAAAKDLIEKLKTDTEIAQTGNPKGDVVVVEFFDYNCGWCKKAFEEIQTLLKEDPNVKVVLYDIPILGPSSHLASRWSLAAKMQGKYWEFHKEAITHQGSIDEEALTKMAKNAGVDLDKLKKDLENPKIDEELKSHLEVIKTLGIQGTPGFLVNDKVFRGYVPYDTLKGAIKDAREASASKE